MLAVAAVVCPPLAYACLLGACARVGRHGLPQRGHAAHNAALAAYSLVVACRTTAHLCAHPPALCAPPAPLPRWLVASWYWSKWWEWGDTVLLYARGRGASRLHRWHHACTASLVALQTWPAQMPLLALGTALNAWVHVAMYAYFADPTAWSRAARAWVTRVQIAQHAVMLVAVVASVCAAEPCARDATRDAAPLLLYAFFFVEFVRLHVRGGAR